MSRGPKRRGAFEGWTIVGWATLLLTAMIAALGAAGGWGEDGLRLLARATARTSVSLFLPAFAAAGLERWLRRGWTAWLLRNRRYVGVSFAVSHTLHLAIILTLGAVTAGRPFADPDPSLIFGGLAYLFIAAMAATSFDRTAAWLGPRRWKLLHTVGGYYLWGIFALNYVGKAFSDPLYVPFALAVIGVLVLRVTFRRSRARRPAPAPSS